VVVHAPRLFGAGIAIGEVTFVTYTLCLDFLAKFGLEDVFGGLEGVGELVVSEAFGEVQGHECNAVGGFVDLLHLVVLVQPGRAWGPRVEHVLHDAAACVSSALLLALLVDEDFSQFADFSGISQPRVLDEHRPLPLEYFLHLGFESFPPELNLTAI